jgi:hypothetical protein
MSCAITKIGICHWDGYETQTKKCSLLKGACIVKNNFGLSLIKIYAGNKYKTIYSDTDFNNIKTLKQLLESTPYKSVLDLGFQTVVMVMFSINSKGDDYWRTTGVNDDEKIQFTEVAKYLKDNYPTTEFILSNWESDCVIESTENIMDRKMYADNIVDLINARTEAVKYYDNVNIALEVNRYYKDVENSISYIIPKVNCQMISYSCYQMLYDNKLLDNTILKIKSLMKPNMELYIGEFGYPTNNDKEDRVVKCIKNNITIFIKHRIRLAFYWNLYCNEKRPDGTFNGFGIINITGDISYVYKELYPTNSYLFTVRHGISLANMWKHQNNTDYISSKNAITYNLHDAGLSFEGLKAIRNSRQSFWDTIFQTNSNKITIFLSPLIRSISTCLESMREINPKYFKNINIYITPIISEYGNGRENRYKTLQAIEMSPEVNELKTIVNNVEFINYVEWAPITKGQYDQEINKYIKPNINETIICFMHWGVINHLYGINSKNFGVNSYINN